MAASFEYIPVTSRSSFMFSVQNGMYENLIVGERSSNCVWSVCSTVCRTSVGVLAFDLFIALRLDFAGLRWGFDGM
jgi:hypothetical protein